MLFLFHTVVVVQFERPLYRINENNTRSTEVCAVVIEPPTLDKQVTFTIETEDGTATGNFAIP